MKKAYALLLGLVVVGVSGSAIADNCKAPKVKVQNDKKDTIKVSKIMYFDGCDNKWRTEDVSVREIAAGASYTWTDDLEYVGNCKITKFKLYLAIRQSTGSAYGAFDWGGELTPDQGSSQTCNTGVTYTIHAY